MSRVKEFFDKLAAAAAENPAEATASNAIFQFNVSGDDGGTFVLDLTEGKTSDFLTNEPNPDAGATINVSDADWVAMLDGELDAMQAFMGGKITIDGDLSLAMNLQSLMAMAR